LLEEVLTLLKRLEEKVSTRLAQLRRGRN